MDNQAESDNERCGLAGDQNVSPHRCGDYRESEPRETDDEGRHKSAGYKISEIKSVKVVHSIPHRVRYAGRSGDTATLRQSAEGWLPATYAGC